MEASEAPKRDALSDLIGGAGYMLGLTLVPSVPVAAFLVAVLPRGEASIIVTFLAVWFAVAGSASVYCKCRHINPTDSTPNQPRLR
jgi:hypothetical protein